MGLFIKKKESQEEKSKNHAIAACEANEVVITPKKK